MYGNNVEWRMKANEIRNLKPGFAPSRFVIYTYVCEYIDKSSLVGDLHVHLHVQLHNHCLKIGSLLHYNVHF